MKLDLAKCLKSHSPEQGNMGSTVSTMVVSPELGSRREWPIHGLSLSLTMREGIGPLYRGPPWFLNCPLVPLIEWLCLLTSPERLLENRPCLSQIQKHLCLHSCWFHSLPYFKKHEHQRSQRSLVLISFNKLAEPVSVRIHPSFSIRHSLGRE